MTTQPRKVFVIGVGMTKFEKPGRREKFDYPDMALEAGEKALKDAGISFNEVQQACVGYCYGDTTCGQRAVYQLGMTGIPIYNVNNACATGSSALMLGRQLIEGGVADCIMALGFEKMEPGSLGTKYTDRTSPMDKHVRMMAETYEISGAPLMPQMFGNAGIEHMKKYGTKPEHFAKIAWKNHKHSTNNPYSQFQDEYSLEQILKAPSVHEYLTKLQCCPTSDGSACAILASEDFVRRHNLQSQAVEIVAQAMYTDFPSTFNEKSCIKVVGYDMTKKAAQDVYRKAGLGPQDIDVIELHDCFSANELITYEALGLCPEGKAGEFIDRGDNTYGGKFVINPSGGLISKGHPLGATGLAQCAELCWQLRGLAGKRQVKDAKVALQHNVGLGGAVVITIYRLGFPQGVNSTTSRIQLSPTSAATDFKSKAIFDEIEKTLKSNGAEFVKKINGVFCFKVKSGNNEGVWVVDVKNGNGSVKYDPQGKGDATISMEDDNLMLLMTGQLNPQQAFFQGKLKISGNMGLAMKLSQLQLQAGKSKL
jgi:sterol carrier protein 2